MATRVSAQRATLNSSSGQARRAVAQELGEEAAQDRAQREAPPARHQDEEPGLARVLADEADAVPRAGRRRHAGPGAQHARARDAREDVADDARAADDRRQHGLAAARRRPSTGCAGQPPPITNVPCGVWRSDSDRLACWISWARTGGRGSVTITWSAWGTMGSLSPTIAAISGVCAPAAHTTRPASTVPAAVRTRKPRVPARSIPIDPRVAMHPGAVPRGRPHVGGRGEQRVGEALLRAVGGARRGAPTDAARWPACRAS